MKLDCVERVMLDQDWTPVQFINRGLHPEDEPVDLTGYHWAILEPTKTGLALKYLITNLSEHDLTGNEYYRWLG